MAAPVKESEYRLSTELTGHSGDVRAVVDLQTDEGQSVYVVTTSRDKTARVWLREDQRLRVQDSEDITATQGVCHVCLCGT